MHKGRAVRATVRKHSQQGDDETEYAIAEAGQLFIGCGEVGTTFDVVDCKTLKGKAEKRSSATTPITAHSHTFPSFLTSTQRIGLNSLLLHLGHRPAASNGTGRVK